MSVIDIVIVVFALAMTGVGYERGLLGSALPLGGFLGGVALGARLAPQLLAGGSHSKYAPLVSAASGVLLGMFLAIALEGLGLGLRERMRGDRFKRIADGVGGAILLAALALGVAWVFGTVALNSAGENNRKLREVVQGSKVLTALNETFPPSGAFLNALRRIDPTPEVKGPQANVAAPDRSVLRDPEVKGSATSVVRILSTACGLGVQGSGWVAGPGIVVTNAHVVAGSDDTTVSVLDGGTFDATVVHYEPRNDLAVLRVDGLAVDPLELAAKPRRGVRSGAIGYPENGPLTVTAARLGRTGRVSSQDSYGRGPVLRSMTPFRGDVRPGNSGGPIVDTDGDVLGTVFAAQVGGDEPSGLAVPNSAVRAALGGELAETGTGPCTAD
jgi:S1-C subfamily serine protease